MTDTLIREDMTILPPGDAAGEPVARAESSARAALVGPDGQSTPLPIEVYDALCQLLAALDRGQAVSLVPRRTVLTTQEAADLLGVSRPTLVRMLEDGKLPYTQPGRHRRILLRDVLKFLAHRREQRHHALDELIQENLREDAYGATDRSSCAEA
jgi:excisionase family DNA binding protein